MNAPGRTNQMTEFDHTTKKASPEWLTSILTRNAFLTTGEVTGVDQRPSLIGVTVTSEFFDLTLEYSARSTGVKPASFLMKVGKPERFLMTRREATFYELARRSDRPNSLSVMAAPRVCHRRASRRSRPPTNQLFMAYPALMPVAWSMMPNEPP